VGRISRGLKSSTYKFFGLRRARFKQTTGSARTVSGKRKAIASSRLLMWDRMLSNTREWMYVVFADIVDVSQNTPKFIFHAKTMTQKSRVTGYSPACSDKESNQVGAYSIVAYTEGGDLVA
jgi:hypothetical protein